MNNFVVPGVSECEFIVLGMRVIKKKKGNRGRKKREPCKNFFLLSNTKPALDWRAIIVKKF
jgi:hypothetical protein